jgi:FkbM family methyltransferase
MIKNVINKLKNKMSVYKNDLKSKGLYWSIIHRLYKITVLKTFLSPIINYLKPEYLIIEGRTFYIDKWDDVISQELILSNKWEKLQTKIFKQNIKKGDVVVDVGAHIGYYTIIAACIVGDSGKVYAFEPDLKNFKILLQNIKANKLNNVIAINKAVSEKNTKLNLFINPNNTGDHRIYECDEKRKSIDIDAVTLNSELKNVKVNLIKMDIQGSEILALKGANNIFAGNKTLKMIIEFWPRGLNLGGGSAKELLRIIQQNKFSLYDIDEIRNELVVTSVEELLIKYGYSPDAFTNLLCVRNSAGK